MAPKRKGDDGEPPVKRKKGGAGLGQGKKPGVVNARGVDHPDAPKRKQLGLGDLLGQRFAKPTQANANADAVKWTKNMLFFMFLTGALNVFTI